MGVDLNRISLGGETLELIPGNCALSDFVLAERYHLFRSQVPASGLVLRVHSQQVVDLDACVTGTRLFTNEHWSLFQAKDELVLHFHIPDVGVYQIIRLSSSFQEGDLYCVGDLWERRHPWVLLNYPVGEVLYSLLLAQRRGILLHACGVGTGNAGILFSGMSGAGKSTMTQLWQQVTEATLLSDDRVIVRQEEGHFLAYGTPWHGSVVALSPAVYPIERIFVLHHARENSARLLSPAEAASQLFARSFPPFWSPEGMLFSIDLLAELSQAIPCYALGFVPDVQVIDFILNLREML